MRNLITDHEVLEWLRCFQDSLMATHALTKLTQKIGRDMCGGSNLGRRTLSDTRVSRLGGCHQENQRHMDDCDFYEEIGVFFGLATTAAIVLISQPFDLVKEFQNAGIGKGNQLLEHGIALRETAGREILA